MEKLFGEDDVDATALRGRRVAVLGYGSQGRAHALNLRDGGVDVGVGLRPGGSSWKSAERDGWRPVEPSRAVRGASVVAMLVPDMAQPALFADAVAPHVEKGATLLFAHGFNVHYRRIAPPEGVDVAM